MEGIARVISLDIHTCPKVLIANSIMASGLVLDHFFTMIQHETQMLVLW